MFKFVYGFMMHYFAFQCLHDCIFSSFIHTGAHHFWEVCDGCFLVFLAGLHFGRPITALRCGGFQTTSVL